MELESSVTDEVFEAILSQTLSDNEEPLLIEDEHEEKYYPPVNVKTELDEAIRYGYDESDDEFLTTSFSRNNTSFNYSPRKSKKGGITPQRHCDSIVATAEDSVVNPLVYGRPRRTIKKKFVLDLDSDGGDTVVGNRTLSRKRKSKRQGGPGRPSKSRDFATVVASKKVGRPKLTEQEENRRYKQNVKTHNVESVNAHAQGKQVEEKHGKSPNKPRKRKIRSDTEHISPNSTTDERLRISASRKKVSEMTEKEREVMKTKWREEARIKRRRKREQMTPEQREEYLSKQREQRRQQRANQRETMSELERDEYNRKARERKKARRSLMTPQQRKEEAQKVTLRRIERLAAMNDEEKQLYKMNIYLSNMARLAKLTPEEIAERRRRRTLYAKQKQTQMSLEDREKRRARVRRYRENMTADQKEKFLDRLRESYRRRVERLKQEPGKWEEVKAQWKENKLRRQKEMKELGSNYKRKRGPRSRPPQVKPGTAAGDDNSETDEERRKRIRQRRETSQRKSNIKRKIAVHNLLEAEAGMTPEEIKKPIETPEKRERRLIRNRVNRAKADLKKRLQESGAPPEDIEAKLSELAATYQHTHNFRTYKPRLKNRKPINSIETSQIMEADGKVSITQLAKSHVTSAPALTSVKSTPSRQIIQVIHPNEPYQTIQIELPPASAQQFSVPLTLPPVPSSTTATSASSTVSSTGTPEPTQFQIIPHQQQHVPHQSLNFQKNGQCHYSNNNSYSPQAHQQQQHALQLQTQHTYSLHALLDTVTFQDAGSSLAPVSSELVVAFVKPMQQNFSFGDYTHNTPPPSPVAEECICDFPGSDALEPKPSMTSSSSTPQLPTCGGRKRGRPRKDDPPVIKQPKNCKPRHGVPRGPKKKGEHDSVNRDAVCDICGNAYNKAYLHEHKQYFHNPNLKDSKCTLCGEKFTVARLFYSHFLRMHVKAGQPEVEKPHMCDECGRSFKKQNNLKKHQYYMHGDGLKKENYKKCPLCPEEKLFKEPVTYYAHLRRKHPDYHRPALHCGRCSKTFCDDIQLRTHCMVEHPGNYFPCTYCDAVKFTEQGLKFHFVRCSKIPKGVLQQMRMSEEALSIEREPVPCEFCERKVTLSSLTRHYWEMHNVKEDKFECWECGKLFKIREFWVVHMVNFHGLEWGKDIENKVKLLNVREREGIEIRNINGVKGGVPGNTARKLKSEERLRTMPDEKKPRKRRKNQNVVEQRPSRKVEEEEHKILITKNTKSLKKRQCSKPKNADEQEYYVTKACPTSRRRLSPAEKINPKKSINSDEEDAHGNEKTEEDNLVPVRRGQLNEDPARKIPKTEQSLDIPPRRRAHLNFNADGSDGCNDNDFDFTPGENAPSLLEDLEDIVKTEIPSDMEDDGTAAEVMADL